MSPIVHSIVLVLVWVMGVGGGGGARWCSICYYNLLLLLRKAWKSCATILLLSERRIKAIWLIEALHITIRRLSIARTHLFCALHSFCISFSFNFFSLFVYFQSDEIPNGIYGKNVISFGVSKNSEAKFSKYRIPIYWQPIKYQLMDFFKCSFECYGLVFVEFGILKTYMETNVTKSKFESVSFSL